MVNICLDGIWKLYYFPQEKFNINRPEQLKGMSCIDAAVPGNVELDLAKAGQLPEDLYFGVNIEALKPYETYEWWYQKDFTVSADNSGQEINLVFHGVDCLATYWLNGTELGSSENMFIDHSFNVSYALIIGGTNTLTVQLKSPIIEAMKKHYDPLLNFAWGTANVEQTWVRKAAHGYGWDIMPRAVTAGLWRSVELVVQQESEIEDVYFYTRSLNMDSAALEIYYNLKINPEFFSDLKIRILGECGDSRFDTLRKVTFKAGTVFMTIDNPKLWWPKGYGAANLYTSTIQLLYRDEVIAEKQSTFGVRTAELIHTDTTDSVNVGEFLIKINGTPILCKGSNWVPADAFHSRDIERYEKILELFDDSGCNMVRCWGGSVYEDSDFFDKCDRMGIMVWQDFAMACAHYPQTPEFLEQIRQEATFIVRKLRNHPSLVVWSGDNEGDLYASYLRGFDPNQNKITRDILPGVIYQCDPFRPYLQSSPYISPSIARQRDFRRMPEDHLWGARDYFKSRFFTESPAHFISEIGYQGCPSLSSIKKFIDQESLWPWQHNKQWILHSSNQVGDQGRVKLMADQIMELFGFEPDNIEDFILASQISQAEAKKFFIEMVRLKKWRKTGIIWWNMMDGWPQFSDAVVDYYFNKKLAYYYIKRVQQPVCIMLDEPENWGVKVVVGNDSNEDFSGQYKIWDGDTGETLLEGQFNSKKNENAVLGSINIFRGEKRLLLIEWTIQDKKYGNHYILGQPDFDLEKYKGWLSKIAQLETKFNVNEIGK